MTDYDINSMTAHLILRGKGLILELGESERYELAPITTIGRHPSCTIQMNHPGISKEHCRLAHAVDGSWRVHDLGSTNGTAVNGQKIEQQTLKHGDELKVGKVVFSFVDSQGDDLGIGDVTLLPEAEESIKTRLEVQHEYRPAPEVTSTDSLREDYEKLRIAHELSQRLALSTEVEAVLEQIVVEIRRIFPIADRAVVFLVGESGDLVPAFVRKEREGEIVLSRAVIDEVRHHQRAVLSADAAGDGLHTMALQGVLSAMCVPLIHRGQLVGAMHLDSVEGEAFQSRDLELFSAIAGQAALAIRNHQMAVEIEQAAQTRAQFERLVSPNLADLLVSGDLQLDRAGSLREVTMLFADIRGFTNLSERLEPTQVVAMLNEYYEIMCEVLFHHGGTLDKYVGDEIIGLFGAPVDRELDALRAVRCGLDMLRALDELNLVRANRGEEAIAIGIGINTGPVVAGAIGSPKAVQYTVIGDAVNVAARLCSQAGPGEVILSQSTYDACDDQIKVETRDPVRVKGKSEPVALYQAIGVTTSETGG